MNLSFTIARRYLFSKKSHNAINVVSMVSVFGVAVAVAALICTLSVFNGFQQLLGSLYSKFDPQIKIKAVEGKSFMANTKAFKDIRYDENVDVYCETIEDNALLMYKDAQASAVVKGVPDNFRQLTRIDSLIYSGEFKLNESGFNYATLGIGLASQLGTGSSFVDPITIYVPRRTGQVNLANPAESFKTSNIPVSGTFGINQREYDNNYAIVPIEFARDLFEYKVGEVSAIEIKLNDGANTSSVIKSFRKMLGDGYTVQSVREQKADFYRINRIEKSMTYLILSFILIIALFNVIGSLSMLIIEKKKDAKTLSELGANNRLIRRIFLNEGRMIALSGTILGVLLGILLCYLQQHFGLIKMGGGGGNYIIDSYPVQLRIKDIIIVSLTAIIVSLPATYWPVQLYFKKKGNHIYEDEDDA